MAKPDLLYAFKHPINALHVKGRQIGVAIEHLQPPVGSSIEEFPNESLQSGANLMGLSDGVRLCDWPKTVQEEMRQGKKIKPDGRHPEHPNI